MAVAVERLSKHYSASDQNRYAPASSIFDRWRGRAERMSADAGDAADDDDELGDDELGDEVPESAVEPGGSEVGGRSLALADVSFSIPSPACLGVIGASGSGKTTLVRLLSGLVPPTAGRVTLRGRVAPTIEFASLLMRSERSPLANARLIARLAGVPRRERSRVAESALALAFPDRRELQSVARKQLFQRLATALALDREADVLLLDEPAFATDADFAERCLARLAEVRGRGAAILLATRDIELVRRCCDRALWLERGRVAALGDVESVISDFEARSWREGRDDGSAATRTAATARGASALALRGFNSSVAILEVRAEAVDDAEVARVSVEDDLVVRVRLEVSRTGVKARCVLRLRREDGWWRSYGQEDPVPELDPGVYDVAVSVPAGSVPPGSYTVEAGAKMRIDGKKSVIGRPRALVLEVEAPDGGALERAEDETAGQVGELADEVDTEEPLFVTWTVERIGD